MKQYLFKISCAVAVVLTVAVSQVNASIINVGDTVRFFDGPGNVGGGEFSVQKLKPDNTWTSDLFITFCLERTESLNLTGDPYVVHDVSQQAIAGGYNYANSAGGTSLPGQADPVDARTAWLFRQFSNGTLADYDFADVGNSVFASRQASANALQRAIWYIEQELTDTEWNALPAAQRYYYDLVSSVSSSALQRALNGVLVLNPRIPNSATGYRQSSLFLVPEPGTMAVWATMMGIALMYGNRRRRDSNAA